MEQFHRPRRGYRFLCICGYLATDEYDLDEHIVAATPS